MIGPKGTERVGIGDVENEEVFIQPFHLCTLYHTKV